MGDSNFEGAFLCDDNDLAFSAALDYIMTPPTHTTPTVNTKRTGNTAAGARNNTATNWTGAAYSSTITAAANICNVARSSNTAVLQSIVKVRHSLQQQQRSPSTQEKSSDQRTVENKDLQKEVNRK